MESGLAVGLDFVVDGLSLFFGLIISVSVFFVTLFAAEYTRDHPHYDRFFTFLHLFSLAMIGMVLSDNQLTLCVFWELTTVLSLLLFGCESDSETAR